MSQVIEQLTAKFREYAPDLISFLLRSGCPPHLAEDIVQEAFYRAIKFQMIPFRRIRNIRAWLYKTTYNLYIDHQRRNKEQPIGEDLAFLGDESTLAEMLVTREQGEVAKEALARVPERQRAAILLCDVSGLSYAEAGDALNTSVATVRGLLHRGRMRLREEYRNLEGGGP
jgi:RNA polymerase sigma-70 factor (ECF subfamily)